MRKQDARKLRLDRETLAPLQRDALDGVAGGASSLLPPITMGCPTLMCVVSLVLCSTVQ